MRIFKILLLAALYIPFAPFTAIGFVAGLIRGITVAGYNMAEPTIIWCMRK